MVWVKVPAEHRPIFLDALPKDPRIERLNMFGGIAAKVNGHLFAGLFGRSTIVQLPEPDRAEALALEGAGPFDPMGNGRVMSQKVMLPESIMTDEEELRAWVWRAFQAALAMPPKAEKAKKPRKMKNADAAPAKPRAIARRAKAPTAKKAPPPKKRPATKSRARR
jgi:TfoX/Sxy family transcriptional regulator of competence genes